MSDDMKDTQATVEFDHPCHETCSGWQQGYERGVYDGGYPDLIRNALDQRDEIAAERDKLRAEVEKLRGALEFYADPKNWRSTHGNGGGVDDTIIDDCEGGWGAGSRARKALKGES